MSKSGVREPRAPVSGYRAPERVTQEFLEQRAGKAKPRELLKFLRKAGNEEPSEADEH